MIPHIGWVELTLIFVIVAMLFGVGKLPEVFGAVGKGVREFRKEATNAENKTVVVKTEQPVETTTES